MPGIKSQSVKAADSADYGTLVHHWKETGETDPPWAAEKDILLLERKLWFSGTDRERIWPAGGLHEITFALHLDTLELRLYDWAECYDLRKQQHEAWKAKFDRLKWLTGTIDYWRVRHVDDLKTGHWLPKPKDSAQLKSYSLVQWVTEGCPADYVGTASFTQWERYPLRARPKRFSTEYRQLDLLIHLDELRWSREHPEEVNVTDHCTFCPCRVQDGPWQWLSPWKYNISCPSGLAQLKVIEKGY